MCLIMRRNSLQPEHTSRRIEANANSSRRRTKPRLDRVRTIWQCTKLMRLTPDNPSIIVFGEHFPRCAHHLLMLLCDSVELSNVFVERYAYSCRGGQFQTRLNVPTLTMQLSLARLDALSRTEPQYTAERKHASRLLAKRYDWWLNAFEAFAEQRTKMAVPISCGSRSKLWNFQSYFDFGCALGVACVF
jgi:hypothetical protein